MLNSVQNRLFIAIDPIVHIADEEYNVRLFAEWNDFIFVSGPSHELSNDLLYIAVSLLGAVLT